MLIAVGNMSLVDCPMLTWSLGWMGFFLPKRLRRRDFDGAIGDDFVGVHVGLRAAAGLPDAQGEVIVEFAGDDFVGGLGDEL